MSVPLDQLPAAVQQALAQVPRGEGRVLVVAGHKLAVYRDPEDQVAAFSPICPHMHGALAWNAAAGTWDCNLHGGRFTATGTVLRGPPTEALAEVPLGGRPPPAG